MERRGTKLEAIGINYGNLFSLDDVLNGAKDRTFLALTYPTAPSPSHDLEPDALLLAEDPHRTGGCWIRATIAAFGRDPATSSGSAMPSQEVVAVQAFPGRPEKFLFGDAEVIAGKSEPGGGGGTHAGSQRGVVQLRHVAPSGISAAGGLMRVPG